LIILATLILIVTCLYFAQAVLVSVALATLLTFLLGAVVSRLQRAGLWRVPALILVLVVAFSLLGLVGWVITRELTDLAKELPAYRKNISQKIADVRGARKNAGLETLQETAKEVVREIEKPTAGARSESPVPVAVQPPSLLSQLPALLGPAARVGLVIVLVIFMLLRQQELRDRLVLLLGHGRLTMTTRALDEAGRRISRYLLMQSIINGTFGLALGVGLSLIGVPYAILWGFLAAVLRFIPYIGVWIVAMLPIAISLAAFTGWMQPILAAALFLGLEGVIYLGLEPWLYSQSAGVSDVALLVAVAFWTWLWGPVGLVLATPLTVCLVVFSKHVAEFNIISVLMGDEPTMMPSVRYYQRLVAMDRDEASEIVAEYLKAHAAEELYEELLLPALTRAKRDHRSGALTGEELEFIVRATGEIIEELEGHEPQLPTARMQPRQAAPAGSAASSGARVRILGCPVRDQADELGLLMFRNLLASTRCDVVLASPGIFASQVVSLVEQEGVSIVCLGALPPGGLAHARYLCRRLRAQFPELRVLVGRWGPKGSKTGDEDLLRSAGVEHIGLTLRETRDAVVQLAQLPPPASVPVSR